MGSVEAYIEVKHDSKSAGTEYLKNEFKKLDYIKQARVITGNTDIILLVEADSMLKLNSYIDCIKNIKGVSGTESHPVLEKLK